MIHRTIPQKYCWTGAATPAQRNTTRPGESPRRASDLFNVTNPPGIDNPIWPIGDATETIKVPSADAFRSASVIAVAWLIGLSRRAGSHLYSMNDEEARWHHWQVTETLGGLGRQYREPAFEALKADPSLRSDELE